MSPEETLAIAVPNKEALQASQSEVLDVARAYQVHSDEDLAAGSLILKSIKTIRERIAETFDLPIKKAHEAHKAFLDAKKEFDGPCAKEEKAVKAKVAEYIDEAKRKADALRRKQEEEERQRQEEQAKKDNEALQAAAAESNAGNTEKADEILNQRAAESSAPPPTTAPIPETPKVDGMSTTTKWSAEVTDLQALAKAVGEGKVPIHYIQANQTMLNQLARASKKADLGVAGVVGVSETGIASRR